MNPGVNNCGKVFKNEELHQQPVVSSQLSFPSKLYAAGAMLHAASCMEDAGSRAAVVHCVACDLQIFFTSTQAMQSAI